MTEVKESDYSKEKKNSFVFLNNISAKENLSEGNLVRRNYFHAGFNFVFVGWEITRLFFCRKIQWLMCKVKFRKVTRILFFGRLIWQLRQIDKWLAFIFNICMHRRFQKKIFLCIFYFLLYINYYYEFLQLLKSRN